MTARELPILFNAPMVRAILEGRKTLTRRVVKLPHANPLGTWEPTTFGGKDARGIEHAEQAAVWHTRTGHTIGCHYGTGDRLWVKETYANLTATHGQPWERRNPDTGLYERGRKPFLWYRADGEQPEIGDGRSPVERWRPSIHMPRWASRIDLEVTGVRVERLHDISEADAMAEGIRCTGQYSYWWDGMEGDPHRTAADAFRALWESINGPGSWDANPWVWVVEFKRIRL